MSEPSHSHRCLNCGRTWACPGDCQTAEGRCLQCGSLIADWERAGESVDFRHQATEKGEPVWKCVRCGSGDPKVRGRIPCSADSIDFMPCDHPLHIDRPLMKPITPESIVADATDAFVKARNEAERRIPTAPVMVWDGLPEISGERMEQTIASFVWRCRVHLRDEQEKIAPDTALIAVLCDAVRLAREYMNAVKGLGTLDATLVAAFAWFDEKIPHTAEADVKKFREEADEFVKEPSVEEAADVVLCITHWAHLMGLDLHAAIKAKMEKNRGRQWRKRIDGTWHHVKPEPA